MAEFPDVLWAEVGQFGFLPVAPQIFDRIDFRGIGREPLDVQPLGLRFEISGHFTTTMDGSAVPQEEDFTWELAVQGAQEGDDPRAVDGAGVQLEVKVAPGQTGDG